MLMDLQVKEVKHEAVNVVGTIGRKTRAVQVLVLQSAPISNMALAK